MLKLVDQDYTDAAAALGCEEAAVRAVCHVETAGGGFLDDGRPKILFESHQFHILTGGQYDGDHPGISTPSWVANYGAAGAHQWDRLEEAKGLDPVAALESASWGLFQIMGENYGLCGFAAVDAFVAAMGTGEKAHLDAFVAFCKAKKLDRYLIAHDWAGFAYRYNGAGFKRNAYDSKLASAYQTAKALGN